MAECMVRDRLPELWQKIDNAHYSYLETDDCLEKLDQRKKLEGYIMDYLCLVPHECKFRLSETSQVFQKSAAELPDFSGYRAAAGWAALAQYAGNLLAQPWRKEYRVIKLYSGHFKHEVESNLAGGEVMLRVMGYSSTTEGCLELDGPICPDLVAAVSRDSLIAYVECQLMKCVWEELCRRGCSRGWREVLAQRQNNAGDARRAIAALLPSSQLSHSSMQDDNMVCQMQSKIHQPIQTCGRQSLMAETSSYPTVDNYNHYSAPIPAATCSCKDHIIPTCYPPTQYQSQHIAPTYCQNGAHNVISSNTQYGYSGMGLVHPYSGMPGYYYAPVAQPYMMQYAPIRQANTVPINGYYGTNVPTAQLIELDPPVQKRKECKSHQKSDSIDKTKNGDPERTLFPRSDTQPSLAKAKEDGTGTFESWDYVFKNLESQGYSKDLGERGNLLSSRIEPKPGKDKKYSMDLEDALRAMSIERVDDEESYRTAKVNEILLKMKLEKEAKLVKANARKVLSDEREKRKVETNSTNINLDKNGELKVTDKTRLISKEDAKDKREIDKLIYINGHGKPGDLKKDKGTTRSSNPEDKERERLSNGRRKGASDLAAVPSTSKMSTSQAQRKKTVVAESSASARNNSSQAPMQNSNERISPEPNLRLVVSLRDRDAPDGAQPPRKDGLKASPDKRAKRADEGSKWECATCTYLNGAAAAACDMCGKSRNGGAEIAPLVSGGKECPACTLVNRRDASACEACNSSLKYSPTYI